MLVNVLIAVLTSFYDAIVNKTENHKNVWAWNRYDIRLEGMIPFILSYNF